MEKADIHHGKGTEDHGKERCATGGSRAETQRR